MKTILLIGSGGFIGTLLRYFISKYFVFNISQDFPWPTLLINIIGSLLLGMLWGLEERGNFFSEEIFLMLTIGLCGGFTTFSTFSGESFQLLKNNQFTYFALYATFSLLLGILAIASGRYLMKVV